MLAWACFDALDTTCRLCNCRNILHQNRGRIKGSTCKHSTNMPRFQQTNWKWKIIQRHRFGCCVLGCTSRGDCPKRKAWWSTSYDLPYRDIYSLDSQVYWQVARVHHFSNRLGCSDVCIYQSWQQVGQITWNCNSILPLDVYIDPFI